MVEIVGYGHFIIKLYMMASLFNVFKIYFKNIQNNL
jgi:hypothetical protein